MEPNGNHQNIYGPIHGIDQRYWRFSWILSKIGLIRFTQSDTERGVKTIRKVENRFTAFNEVKLNSGKRDRANQEVFLHENPVALTNLPLEKLNKLWLKKHKSSLKSNSTKNVAVENYIKKDKSKAQFLD